MTQRKKLIFRYGTMGSGKTTDLLQVAKNYESNGFEVLILKPSVDTKGNRYIVSRLGVKRKADMLIDKEDNIKDRINYFTMDCILVDEAQFLTSEQVKQLLEITQFKKVTVICYGLRTDFKGELFEGSKQLLAWAHSIEEFKSVCWCGKHATFTLRKLNNNFVFFGSQLLIDNTENVQYESVCAKCFLIKYLLDK